MLNECKKACKSLTTNTEFDIIAIMKAKVTLFEKEGFVSGFGLLFDNGLVLRTNTDLAWCSEKEKKEITDKFKEVIQQLNINPCVIEDQSYILEVEKGKV